MIHNSFSTNDLILITGASSGIGYSTALKLNQLGARVVGIARQEEKLIALKNECLFPDNFSYIKVDLSSNLPQIKDVIKNIVSTHGKISGFVHAAGILNPQPLSVLDEEDMLKDFNVNLFSSLFLTKAIASKKNKQDQLNIVYVSSITAKIGNPGAISYCMTKASLNAMITSLAQEIGSKTVRINGVMPGACETAMAHHYNEMVSYDYLDKIKKKNLFNEVMQPGNVSDLICFLLSDSSRWIQGQSIIIDGGETLAC